MRATLKFSLDKPTEEIVGAVSAALKGDLKPARRIGSVEIGRNLPCPICNGVEGCDHSVPERARAAARRRV